MRRASPAPDRCAARRTSSELAPRSHCTHTDLEHRSVGSPTPFAVVLVASGEDRDSEGGATMHTTVEAMSIMHVSGRHVPYRIPSLIRPSRLPAIDDADVRGSSVPPARPEAMLATATAAAEVEVLAVLVAEPCTLPDAGPVRSREDALAKPPRVAPLHERRRGAAILSLLAVAAAVVAIVIKVGGAGEPVSAAGDEPGRSTMSSAGASEPHERPSAALLAGDVTATRGRVTSEPAHSTPPAPAPVQSERSEVSTLAAAGDAGRPGGVITVDVAPAHAAAPVVSNKAPRRSSRPAHAPVVHEEPPQTVVEAPIAPIRRDLVDVPTEVSEAPTEVPAEAPTEVPAEAPTEAPAEAPADMPADAPASG